MKTMKSLCFVYFLFWLSLCISCASKRHIASSRLHLEMPNLVEVERFKKEIPINELKSLQSYAKEQGYLTPGLDYFFSIDIAGNVVDGKFDGLYNERLSFFKSYINNTFITYKWHPAFYTNTHDTLRTVAKISIYENPKKHFFEISIRLIYLPDKEKIQDISFEKKFNS